MSTTTPSPTTSRQAILATVLVSALVIIGVTQTVRLTDAHVQLDRANHAIDRLTTTHAHAQELEREVQRLRGQQAVSDHLLQRRSLELHLLRAATAVPPNLREHAALPPRPTGVSPTDPPPNH